MQKTLSIGHFFYKNIYLLVVAAWFITISFVVDNYWSANASLKSVQKKINGYVHSQENDFTLFANDKDAIQKVANGTYSEEFLANLAKKKYFLFFYDDKTAASPSLVCWNTQKVLPLPFMLYDNLGKGFVQLENGYYVWHRVNTGPLKVIALIPVKWNYFITNEYLQNNFVFDESLALNYDISLKPDNALVIKSADGAGLFYVYEKGTSAVSKNNRVAVLLQVLSVILLLIFIHLLASFLAVHRQLWKGLLFLLLAIHP